MTKVDSTVTLSEVRTAPPANGKDLITECVGPAAHRPDGKNLLIQIEVGSEIAKFHCIAPEHAGTHSQRHVLFEADKDCWVIFTNKSVFTEEYLELAKGESVPAWVSDDTQKGETDCVIRVKAEKTAKPGKVVKMETVAVPKHGPVIVVP